MLEYISDELNTSSHTYTKTCWTNVYILFITADDDIRRCIVSGLFPNAAYLHPSGVFRTVKGDIPLHVHSTSVLYAIKPPSWVVYSELIHTNKLLMKDITVI